jgi:DNA-binding response OmpR family regulator
MEIDMVLIDDAPLMLTAPQIPRHTQLGHVPHILVADDDDDLRELVAMSLRLAGYAVATTDDGPTALAILNQQHPDLAVLDVIMPGISGFEICRRLHDRLAAAPPVILLSGKTAPAAVQAGLDAGAAFYHPKPLDLPSLLRDIRTMV